MQRSPITCDQCGFQCPPLKEAQMAGWYLSSKLSVSGIPWDVLCPRCKGKNKLINDMCDEYRPQPKK